MLPFLLRALFLLQFRGCYIVIDFFIWLNSIIGTILFCHDKWFFFKMTFHLFLSAFDISETFHVLFDCMILEVPKSLQFLVTMTVFSPFQSVTCWIILSLMVIWSYLSSFTIVHYFSLQFSSTWNLSFLKEVKFSSYSHNLVFISWLQVLTNAKHNDTLIDYP